MGKTTPESASAVPFALSLTVCGKSPQIEFAGPPEQVILTLPEKPFTDVASSRNAPTLPRLIVSEPGVAVNLKPDAGATVKPSVTEEAAV